MRKFFLKILIPVIVLIVAANTVSYLMFVYFKEDYFLIKDFGWVSKLDEKPRIILMGSSAVGYNVDPVLMSERLNMKKGRIINLSTNAQTPIQSYFIAKEYLSELDSVKMLFYSLDPWIFSEIYYKNDDLLTVNWSIRQRLFNLKAEKLQQILFGSRPEKVLRTLFSRKRIFDNDKPAPSRLGASTIPVGITVKNFNESVDKWFEYGIFGYSEFQFQYLKKLKDYVEGRGIKFVILLTPKTSEWRNNYYKLCSEADKDFLTLFNSYLGDVYTVGSYDIISYELQPGFFVDSIHLNEEGQKYFSDVVSGFVRSIDTVRKERLTSFIR